MVTGLIIYSSNGVDKIEDDEVELLILKRDILYWSSSALPTIAVVSDKNVISQVVQAIESSKPIRTTQVSELDHFCYVFINKEDSNPIEFLQGVDSKYLRLARDGQYIYEITNGGVLFEKIEQLLIPKTSLKIDKSVYRLIIKSYKSIDMSSPPVVLAEIDDKNLIKDFIYAINNGQNTNKMYDKNFLFDFVIHIDDEVGQRFWAFIEEDHLLIGLYMGYEAGDFSFYYVPISKELFELLYQLKHC